MATEPDLPRDLLLRCATRLFATRGYPGVGVQEIVEAARVTKPTLYHHFGNKLGLLEAVLQAQRAALTSQLTAAAAYAGDLTTTLRTTAMAYFAFAGEQPDFYRLLLLLWFSPPDSEERSVSGELFVVQQTVLEAMFQHAARDHGNVKGRHQAYAVTFLGTINTYIGLHLNGRLKLDRRLTERVIHQFMHGILS